MVSNQWRYRASHQNIIICFSKGLVAHQRYQCLVLGSILMRSTKRFRSLPHLEPIRCHPLWAIVTRKVEPIQEDTPILKRTRSMHKIQGRTPSVIKSEVILAGIKFGGWAIATLLADLNLAVQYRIAIHIILLCK